MGLVLLLQDTLADTSCIVSAAPPVFLLSRMLLKPVFKAIGVDKKSAIYFLTVGVQAILKSISN